MLLKLLTPQDKSEFLAIAELLTLCDKPLLWYGKKVEVIIPLDNFDNVSIQKDKKEVALLDDLAKEGQVDIFTDMLSSSFFKADRKIERKLLDKMQTYPLQKIEETATRLEAALAVLRDLLKDKKAEFPSVPKLMLFELMQVALVDGNISSIEWQLLNEFKQHYKLQDYVFDELLERAEVTSREISKTITIILE